MTDHPSRRDLMKYAGLVAATGTLGCGDDAAGGMADAGAPDAGADASTVCPITGTQTAGPYYPGEPASRMNIVGNRVGVGLDFRLTVLASGTCEPLEGAEVDVWTADSNGDYSGYLVFDTVGEDWLRGQQRTAADGTISVLGIVPGAYPGRAVHVHIKVRAQGRPELTTQLYFPDAMVASVLTEPGYQGAEQTLNAVDGFYTGDTLLSVDGDIASGFVASGTVYV